ncbi:DNA invertase Pin-like site-specific DNA recombinase [Duganella sp. SG902]|uniref:recombinase family protein n=1 Tax=Duganella sp. SG902 TaxID=2587016 RepID=UPI00159D5853|nr:recombinase family protein [Duganella sp. SG902]NVM77452.1 DNA invertase Pin-like site-specific DNA recombinase [Duganella sp. SG902]
MSANEQQSTETAAVPAALYLRASTHGQSLSPVLQQEFLANYAAEHRMRVVRVYLDQGRSGLVLAGRRGMRQLLDDVCNGHAEFEVLLVYDVSRWGRFQNIDEAGCYEFFCTMAGIRVLYCAEPFVNDGTPLAQLLKSYKRSMAAEFSRELSNKVYAGLRLLALGGYKLGGRSPYGLRRVAVDAQGRVVRELADGERKPRPTDRVRQMPGSSEELDIIKRIYHLYASCGVRVAAIARLLNAEGVSCRDGDWTSYKVDAILRKEEYRGVQLYNRTSLRLKSAKRHNPTAQWIRCEHAFPAIVGPLAWRQAARVRRLRNEQDRATILATLRALYACHGKVTLTLLADVPGMPGWHVLKRLFGSLKQACALAGIDQPRMYPACSRHPGCVQAQHALCLRVRALVAQAGGQAQAIAGTTNEFLINGALRLRVVVKACQPVGATPRWLVAAHLARPVDFVLAGLLDPDSGHPGRYALIDTARESRPLVRFGRRFHPASASVVEALPLLFGAAGEGEAEHEPRQR